MDREATKEELKVYSELLKILTAFLISVGGGTATLFITLDSGTKAILFLLGLIIESFFVIAFISVLMHVNSLIRRLKG